jgi:nitrate/nitrite transport system ATP-binding protein
MSIELADGVARSANALDVTCNGMSAPTAPAPQTHGAEVEAPLIRVENLSKVWPGQAESVFADLNFTLHTGEFVCVIGHSGCGKTTILNILAGLDTASGGQVFLAGRELQGPGLDRGVVFQQHALLPWLTVQDNVAFAVRAKYPGWTKAQVTQHVAQYLALVKLSPAAGRKPHELSGGMRQRVGIARALAIAPRMLLLDEPFGALDALTRATLQDELRRICGETRQTVFMITHDVDEAILLDDRIFLMSTGPRAQLAEIVRNPLPSSRTRASLHHETEYTTIRNQLLDFLIHRADA